MLQTALPDVVLLLLRVFSCAHEWIVSPLYPARAREREGEETHLGRPARRVPRRSDVGADETERKHDAEAAGHAGGCCDAELLDERVAEAVRGRTLVSARLRDSGEREGTHVEK